MPEGDGVDEAAKPQGIEIRAGWLGRAREASSSGSSPFLSSLVKSASASFPSCYAVLWSDPSLLFYEDAKRERPKDSWRLPADTSTAISGRVVQVNVRERALKVRAPTPLQAQEWHAAISGALMMAYPESAVGAAAAGMGAPAASTATFVGIDPAPPPTSRPGLGRETSFHSPFALVGGVELGGEGGGGGLLGFSSAAAAAAAAAADADGTAAPTAPSAASAARGGAHAAPSDVAPELIASMSDGGSDEADDEADGQRRREKAQLEDEVRALQEAKAEAKAELERLRAECRRLQESCFHARTGTAGNIAGSTAGSRSGGRRDSLQVGQSDAPASRAIDRALADARAAVDALRPPLAPRVSDDGHEGEQWSVEGWSASLGLDKLLAARLCAPLAPLLEGLAPPARSAAQLAYVRSLGSLGEQSAKVAGGLDPDPDQPHPQPHPQPQPQHIMEAVLGGGDALAEVASLYAASSARLGREFASVEELLLSSKYVQEGELYFSTLSAFNAGLDATIGSPHPKLQESMEGEHTAKADSCKFFTAGNYGITTQSRVEWFFVVDPSEGLRKLPKDALPTGGYPGETQHKLALRKRRFAMPLHTFDVAVSEVNAELRKLSVRPMRQEELIGARLYTGPMFQKYNAVMRALPQEERPAKFVQNWKRDCEGNKYTTTM